MTDILDKIADVLEQRKQQDPDTSYVSSLYRQGTDAILKKVGEEAAEVIIAAKGETPDAVVHEIADLWFHTMVLLSHHGLTHGMVLAELERRFGHPGLEEKAGRTK